MLTSAHPHGAPVRTGSPRKLVEARARTGVAFGIILLALTAVLVGLVPSPALAQEDDDGEGGNRSLRDDLDEAASAYQDAKAVLEESEKRELTLVVELETLEDERDGLVDEIQLTAVTAYRNGRVGAVSALLNSASPAVFLERAVTIEVLAQHEDDQLAQLNQLSESVEEQQARIAEEIAIQEEEVAKLEDAKDQAEQALFAIGGGATGEFEAYPAEDAKPAERNSDGSFSAEDCVEPDPTGTGGCVTRRMLHALNEAKLFGFTRYTSCWRSGTFGEHPFGRACDMAASNAGFGGPAVGEDKTYGDRLASFLVHNADALAVQYVIWYRQIWFPGSGWRSYSGACGDASCDHTNHVHVSLR